MIAFRMKTTLVCFQDEYYNYKGVVEEESKTNNEDNNGLVDKVAEGKFFQFTAEVWKPLAASNLPTVEEEEEDLGELLPEEWAKWEELVTVVEENEFPYLNMKMYWENKTLQLAMYNKENQMIQYVSKDSCHQPSVFKAIPSGVFTCMGKLTSLTLQNEKKTITNLYPLHAKALRKANL
eukprot:1089421-Ditylum_brightwellii.AAC.1